MQIIESTLLGLRSARLTFGGDGSRATVTLFPMIHIAEPSFYRAVYEDAGLHDVVLLEGVRSPIARRVTRSYRWLIGSPRLHLALQPAYRPDAGGARPVHADLSHEEFVTHWRGLPLWMRLLIYVGAPIAGLHLRFSLTREKLAQHMSLDDAKSRDEILDWSPESGALDRVILEARDERLLERLREQLADPAVRRIAVIYGAGHMRAVIRELTNRQGYRVAAADWLTVFSL